MAVKKGMGGSLGEMGAEVTAGGRAGGRNTGRAGVCNTVDVERFPRGALDSRVLESK